MAEQLKREVREKAHRRLGKRAVLASRERISDPEITTSQPVGLPQESRRDQVLPVHDHRSAIPDARNHRIELSSDASTIRPRRGTDCTLASEDARGSIGFGRSDTILLMFYLEHLLPFLFPFYNPSPLQGGRAWILEMMISSPVVRQATLCQSSYFFSLAQGISSHDASWETVLAQTRNAFEALKQSLEIISGSSISEHVHGAARILASIIQVQRFEISVLSFNNCQAHLNAALVLFEKLLESCDAVEQTGPLCRFNNIITRLGPSSWILPAQRVQVSSAEQAAFRFSSTLLILDDIVASIVLQKQPRLYEYHYSLLGNIDGIEASINLEAVVGCQNWVILQVGEIAALDAWKQQCKRAGNLDMVELVNRATAIKNSLQVQLALLESDPIILPKVGDSLFDILTTDYRRRSNTLADQTSIVTRTWGYAALIYLTVVISGWQPASVDVRHSVGQILDLLTNQTSAPSLLRTVVWPFCIAGCLAEPAQESHFRGLAQTLQPPSVFGTVGKALEIMQNVWQNRCTGDAASRDIATCFRSQGDLVLLV
ncbi:hypothetical protein AB5N19_05678 [Seiridium cardinale]|uniref:Uncharacterized protein n=1 Tax=Seiridium cardinale TaxID=138064 RepID=A0ABR2XJJ1_9PEZI